MHVRLATLDDVPEATAAIRSADRVAVDTEFHAERRYLPELYLVQVQIPGGDTWILDPLVTGLLHALAEPLLEATWIVHGGHQDMRLLLDALGDLPQRVLDTQIAAALVDNVFPAPYQHLLSTFLDREIDKAATLSDWSRRPLSREQVRYAAEDVRLLLPLWERIEAALRQLGREAVAEAACAEARRAVTSPAPADTTWRAITAACALSGPQLAALQELAAWREDVARAGNQPPRSVVADAILVDVARRVPATSDALASNRRVSRSLVRRHGDAIVECVQRAARRPEWAWPRVVRPGTAASRVATWLLAFAEAEGRDHRFAQRLVLPRDRVEDLALELPVDRTRLAEILGPWRDDLVGDRVFDGLEGRAPLRIHRGDTSTR